MSTLQMQLETLRSQAKNAAVVRVDSATLIRVLDRIVELEEFSEVDDLIVWNNYAEIAFKEILADQFSGKHAPREPDKIANAVRLLADAMLAVEKDRRP